ncbi:MAG: bifunctional tRNA (5-methylaminomethyl-2-thiouridine)(34)-methyltransferase MnmD/FAD-dependent 5-carboxymethylaminomethyl-2-thiouridine(34) oxidoreductase MnmC [Phycisphaeraceae bacterium]|nr:bifunctional tRNA (5-methylaminomethyl-2-thiouridine)(34)-methyltransferase MnmD/FAD-dependent 5-carboxymethylaminomethyl-2-thiouridine(34) oxidoreductase MnmC [Phycisphaeraceae bacterium]
MPNDAPHFDDAGRLIAPKYDDVYFSAEDGLAETRHVFLEGNRLAKRFAEMNSGECFTIGETGFGTGLNFLAAWRLFDKHARADTRLEFVSVEGFPLGRETMKHALSPWPELTVQRESLLQQWGPIWAGVHRFRFAQGRVRLRMLVGEAAEVLASIDVSVDAWFLDGFAPSRNPEMWSEQVFKQVARCSRPSATIATYTAAGFVRRGLQAVGFEIEKTPGFGTKRDMTVGTIYAQSSSNEKGGGHSCLPSTEGRSAIVIGGSLAGAFAARALAERGVAVTVVERQVLVDGELPALSPRASVLQPKISDQNDVGGRWLRGGYGFAYRLLESDDGLRERCGWQRCGTFQASTDERTERRLRRFVEQFAATGLCQWIDSGQTEERCGIALPVGGVWVRAAGILWPAGLCAGLLDHPGITLRDGVASTGLKRAGSAWRVAQSDGEVLEANTVVLANAMAAMELEQAGHVDLRPVRGQVTLLRSAKQAGPLTSLRCPVFYGGYLLPPIDGQQALGASFIPGDTDLSWRDSEHADVCDKLARILPDEAEHLRGMHDPSGWVGMRVTTRNHRACAQAIDEGLYVSLGHGSHGIASAAIAGDVIAGTIQRDR